ncbi:MAG: hypothetical protein J6J21_06145 [Clostridia bacterium]|nr:hypothetical protein [Clostridia bacterium]MBQ2731168.1 hypothetical protein [Clostridia bacterium]
MKNMPFKPGARVRLQPGACYTDGTSIPRRLIFTRCTVLSVREHSALLSPIDRHVPLCFLKLEEDTP